MYCLNRRFVVSNKPEKVRSDRERRGMFASIRSKEKVELLEEIEEYAIALSEDQAMAEGFIFSEDEEEDWFDEDGNCLECGESEDNCFCREDCPEMRDFVPYDD